MDIVFNEDILELEGIDNVIRNSGDESKYLYEGKSVPRVTRIISHNEDKDGLISWAASMGYGKYNYYKEKALNIGIAVHEAIDSYLSSKYLGTQEYPIEYELYTKDYRSGIYNAFENFKLWDARLESLNSKIEEVVGLEIPVVCPWYGGTIDGIVKINGAYYIIDFKTSKQISYNYLVQAAAYMWIINNGYAPNLPPIDGIGIIRVDKAKLGVYNDIFLNNFVTEQRLIIESYQRTFAAYVESYYRGANAKFITENYNYNPIDFFKR